MMKSVTRVFTLFIGVGVTAAWSLAGGGLASAQSLGDLARQETERRKTIQAPAKVTTDDDLEPAGPVVASSAPTTLAAPPAAPVAAPPRSSVNTPAEGKYVAREASYWLNRMRELKTRQDRFRLQAAALQNRVDGLTSDFDSAWDRRQRATLESERQKVRTERDLVVADIAATDKQIFDLEEEARRSNVPPGWLRP